MDAKQNEEVMGMTDAPKQIWAHQTPDRPLRLWRLSGHVKGSTEYLRADHPEKSPDKPISGDV